jgi:hypothetical protein
MEIKQNQLAEEHERLEKEKKAEIAKHGMIANGLELYDWPAY